MKGSKQEKLSAEDWVLIARKFGEDCVKIQQDAKLSNEKKLEQQKKLALEMENKIQSDAYLNEADKKQMIASIHHYMNEWKVVHETFITGREDESKVEKKAKAK